MEVVKNSAEDRAQETMDSRLSFQQERGLFGYIWVVVYGFFMGAANVVPGVSGGTMAFIFGIYQELVESIRMVAQPLFWRSLLRFRIGEAFKILNFLFLMAIGIGAVIATVSLAPGLEWLLKNEPVLLWSFFFGLVIASVLMIIRDIQRWTIGLWIAIVISTVVTYFIVGLVPVSTPNDWWFLALSGGIAICAMILPGLSGSFILVLMGKYQFFVSALNDRDFVSLGLAGIGAVIGLVTFAQILSWLFKRYHDLTVAILTGLMIGSLRKIWPWKRVDAFILDRHGEMIPTVEINILPEFAINGAFNMEVLYALGLAALGFVLVMLLERLGSKST